MASSRLELHADEDLPSPRGYSTGIFVELLDPEYICGRCRFALKNAVMIESCGHRFCEGCVEYMLQENEAVFCPSCFRDDSDHIEEITTAKFHVDYACRRNMNMRQVMCPNCDAGCEFRGTLALLEFHADYACRRNMNTRYAVHPDCDAGCELRGTVTLLEEAYHSASRLLTLTRKMQGQSAERDALSRELREAIQQRPSSFNGVLIWQIKEASRECNEALSAASRSISSPPFYTSRAGYKLCGRTYLNGDGIGQNWYLSLYIVVMKGKYDAILQWPFKQLITFTLFDQSGQEQHIKQSFEPDPTSDSFHRPRSEMNIASGCTRFMNLSDLRRKWSDYVGDCDTLMIKIEVDTQNLDNFGGHC